MDVKSIFPGLQSDDFNLDEDSFGARGLRERYVYDGRKGTRMSGDTNLMGTLRLKSLSFTYFRKFYRIGPAMRWLWPASHRHRKRNNSNK